MTILKDRFHIFILLLCIVCAFSDVTMDTENDDVCLNAIARNPILLQYCAESSKSNRMIVSKAVMQNPATLTLSDAKFKDDKLLIMSAFTRCVMEPQKMPVEKINCMYGMLDANFEEYRQIYLWISDN